MMKSSDSVSDPQYKAVGLYLTHVDTFRDRLIVALLPCSGGVDDALHAKKRMSSSRILIAAFQSECSQKRIKGRDWLSSRNYF